MGRFVHMYVVSMSVWNEEANLHEALFSDLTKLGMASPWGADHNSYNVSVMGWGVPPTHKYRLKPSSPVPHRSIFTHESSIWAGFPEDGSLLLHSEELGWLKGQELESSAGSITHAAYAWTGKTD